MAIPRLFPVVLMLGVFGAPWVQQATGTLPSAGAAEATPGARAFIEAKHRELNDAIRTSKDPRKDPKLLAIFDQLLDYEALTRDAMGDHWEELNEAQQGQFRDLLKQLIQKSYRKNLRDSSRYAVTYEGESAAKNGTRVRTLVRDTKTTHEKPMSVDYVVDVSTGASRVRDIVTEEVSLVGNYRKQFARLLKRRGPDGLLAQMRKQLDE
jgi:ABC-type transporter MlaC component